MDRLKILLQPFVLRQNGYSPIAFCGIDSLVRDIVRAVTNVAFVQLFVEMQSRGKVLGLLSEKLDYARILSPL